MNSKHRGCWPTLREYTGHVDAPEGTDGGEVRVTSCGWIEMALQRLREHGSSVIWHIHGSNTRVCSIQYTHKQHRDTFTPYNVIALEYVLSNIPPLIFSIISNYQQCQHHNNELSVLSSLTSLTSRIVHVHEYHVGSGCQDGVELLVVDCGKLSDVPHLTSVHWHVDLSLCALIYVHTCKKKPDPKMSNVMFFLSM